MPIRPVVILEETINGTNNTGIVLKETAWPRVRYTPRSDKRLRYMHDGAPCYLARAVLTFLKDW